MSVATVEVVSDGDVDVVEVSGDVSGADVEDVDVSGADEDVDVSGTVVDVDVSGEVLVVGSGGTSCALVVVATPSVSAKATATPKSARRGRRVAIRPFSSIRSPSSVSKVCTSGNPRHNDLSEGTRPRSTAYSGRSPEAAA